MQANARDYLAALKDKNLQTSKVAEAIDPKYLPKYGKFTYSLDLVNQTNGTIVDAVTLYKAKQKLYQEEGQRVAGKILTVQG